MPPRAPHPEEIERKRLRQVRAERVLFLATSVFFLAVILASLASTAALSPVACAPCHSAQVSTLKGAAHEKAACDSCHAGPGAFGLVDTRLRQVGMVPAALSGASASGASVGNDGCLSCHEREIMPTVSAKGLRMSHREVVKAEWDCTQCHKNTGHAPDGKEIGTYTMGMCLTCHSVSTSNIETCRKCHPENADGTERLLATTAWRVTHGPNWQKTHGMGDLKTCRSCHSQDYCVSCHNMQLPHPPGFPNDHGKVVLQRETGRKDCVVCHKASACDDCHGVPMPHAGDFLQKHSKEVVKTGDTVCERCHDKKSCERCHVRHTHPGIPPDQLKKLQAEPVSTR